MSTTPEQSRRRICRQEGVKSETAVRDTDLVLRGVCCVWPVRGSKESASERLGCGAAFDRIDLQQVAKKGVGVFSGDGGETESDLSGQCHATVDSGTRIWVTQALPWTGQQLSSVREQEASAGTWQDRFEDHCAEGPHIGGRSRHGRAIPPPIGEHQLRRRVSHSGVGRRRRPPPGSSGFRRA